MTVYAGLDVSMDETPICIRDESGHILGRQGGVEPDRFILNPHHQRPRLGLVGIQDSHLAGDVIHTLDGTLRTDRRPVGKDGTALFGQADGPRT